MVLLLFAAPLFVVVPVFAPSASVYLSVEPVAVAPLTDVNASINGLEAPASPSPVGHSFNVEIHLIGATGANLAGVEVHFDFSAILPYAQPVGYTNMLGGSGGVLSGGLIYTIQPGLYEADGFTEDSPPYTNATQYQVAAASTTKGWNGTDGVVAIIQFNVTGQPSWSLGQQDFVAPLTIIYADLVDLSETEVSHSLVQGTLRIDASGTQPSYGLTVNVVGGGSVTESPLNATYLSGTVVTLTAVPSLNWTFQGWSGDVSSVQNPVNITMNGNKTVTATFVQVFYTLTVNVVGSGSVTENPAAATYLTGTVVTLTAVPSVNWIFWNWSGDVSGSQNPVNITMNGNKTATATFVPISGEISQTVPAGTTTVGNSSLGVSATITTTTSTNVTVATYSSNPGGTPPFGALGKYVDVHLDTSAGVSEVDIRVYFTPADVAAAGLNEALLKLYWWNGTSWLSCSNTGVDTVNNYIWADINATSTPNVTQLTGTLFGGGALTQIYYTLTVNVIGLSVNVTVSPLNGPYLNGTSITLAVFKANYDGQNDTKTANATYVNGTVVTLTAVPGVWYLIPNDNFSAFWGWSGDLSGHQGSMNVTMDGDKNVTAWFGLLGDFNHDGYLTLQDIVYAFGPNTFNSWHVTNSSSNWNSTIYAFDVRNEGKIDLLDLVTVAYFFYVSKRTS
jgi:uncharacterized repeat protein (TIGR02543 family)